MGAHHHASPAHRWRLAVAFAITTAVLLAEVAGALITGSLALLVDAAHMLTDAGGLLMALLASTLMARPPTARRTWGFLRAEVLAALAQAAILLAVGLYAFIEGLQRLFAPPEVASGPLLLFGILGLAGNLASLAVLGSGRGANLNMRAAFLEVLNDALGSVAVIASALVIATTGWAQADAVAGMLIAVLIVPRTLKILAEAAHILLESTPRDLDLAEVRDHLEAVPHVVSVHDLHASQIATGSPCSAPTSSSRTTASTTGTPPRSWTSSNTASPSTSTWRSTTPPSNSNPPPTPTTNTPPTTDPVGLVEQ